MEMKIHNIKDLTQAELVRELDKGGKFVVYQYCISIIIMTFKRSGDIHFLRAGESSLKFNIAPTLVSLLLGWWGFPWGPVYPVQTIYQNLTGGKDVTFEVMESGFIKNDYS